MKMPDRLDAGLLAPCGINCAVCYKYVKDIRPCSGCLTGNENKTARCRDCKITTCAQQKGVARCYECAEFPCGRVRSLDKSYVQRYGVSLVENGRAAHAQGPETFMQAQTAQWRCRHCGGILSVHTGMCSSCGGATDGRDG